MRWKTRLEEPNIHDWVFLSTPHPVAVSNGKLSGVNTLAYTGGITLAGESTENYRYQRPALHDQVSACFIFNPFSTYGKAVGSTEEFPYFSRIQNVVYLL